MIQQFLLRSSLLALLACLPRETLLAQVAAPKTGPFQSGLYQGAQWRQIGPYRGGRSVAVAGVPGQDQVYYMGSTGGGVWKTTDAGQQWENISDGFFQVGSIGAVAVAPSDPNVVYVGAGEHAVRGVMTSHGDGVYRSLDAGKTWEHLPGLEDARHIAGIAIHPQDPAHLYVAVQGAVHGPTTTRGVYESQDGGQTWEHLLFVNPTTGAADLSMDPRNPRILFAAMWDHQRTPWQVRSGGPGSGLYRSRDGGKNWEELTDGLPAEMGKLGVAVSPANSDVVYANIEAGQGGVYRSNNGGDTWTQVNDQRLTTARAWYYMEIVADPVNENTVYVLNAPLLRSLDGGRTFERIDNPHGDQHALWINPADPRNMILGNDGGACISFNSGNTWSSEENQPTAQFYRVIADNRFPYYVYGGQQDNSTVAIASRSVRGMITGKEWYPVSGGESAFIAFDPDDPRFIYGGSYQGNISVYDHRTGETKDVMAYPNVGLATLPREMRYRFNWNAPIVASPQDPRIIYHGAQLVLRSRDGGQNWQEISPDLTRNDPEKQGLGGVPFTNEGAGGENYNTISYLACSPHDAWVIWVGSDDGLVHLTRDEGQSWENVTPPELGECLINSIEVSPHDPATAFVVATRYKFNDFLPLIYRTQDFGKTWTKVTRGIGSEDFVRVVREDPLRQGLLYAGTETGLYLSYNNGAFWHRFQLNLPVCPINDLTIRDNDLIAATSGRGFWILDDLGFIQQSAGYLLGNSAQVFRPKTSYRVLYDQSSEAGAGENPLPGVIIDYYLPAHLDSTEIRLQILDESGLVIRAYSSEADPDYKRFEGGPPPQPKLPTGYGIFRFNWDLRRAPIAHVPGLFVLGNYQGGMVAPGTYTLRLIAGDDRVEQTCLILADPRLSDEVSSADYAKQSDFLLTIEKAVTDIHSSVEMMRELRTQFTELQQRLDHLGDQEELRNYCQTIVDKINDWEEQLVQPQQETYQDVINFPNRLNAELMNLHSRVDTNNPRVTAGAQDRLSDLLAAWEAMVVERDTILYSEVQAFNDLYQDRSLPAVIIPRPREVEGW
ncbi:MAG: glycosyl hydrolase [Lewinella sp.]|nr:glycosyl hydrolase [Lewinella sp.]